MYGNRSFLIVILILLLILIKLFKKIKEQKLEKRYFERYSKFLGNAVNEDHLYHKKMNTIINLINKNKITNLDEIARLSGCDFYETIVKIKFLKKQKLIDNYYIDIENKILNQCSEEDKKLLEKYDQFIYNKHMQPEYIAKSLPSTTKSNYEKVKKQVLDDLYYLDKKNLLNGINVDLVDEKLIYYDIEQLKESKDYVSVNCMSCGAPNEVPRNGKVRCEYCNRILTEEDEKK